MSAHFTLPHEPAPRDFSARLRRARPRTIAAAKRRRTPGRHALVLLGAVALPALAAPEQWQALGVADAGRSTQTLEPMPFEQAGNSFPGSAFYYLAPEDIAPTAIGEGIHSDGAPAPSGPLPGTEAVARALRVDNSGIDRSRALQCLTAAVYYEAASEPDSGQRAVAQVVLNRVAHPAYPNTVCGVVFQGSERKTGCQFSFTCDGSLARVPHRMFWLRAENVARAALAGYVHAPAGLATHYHTIHVSPYWAPKLHYLGTIGLHRFYRFGGAAGHQATFRFAYAGGEPVAAPHARAASAGEAAPDAAVFDPAAVQAAYDEGLRKAQASGAGPAVDGGLAPARLAPAPAYTPEQRARGGDTIYRGERLPEANGVKEQYRNSGRWIAQPGT